MALVAIVFQGRRVVAGIASCHSSHTLLLDCGVGSIQLLRAGTRRCPDGTAWGETPIGGIDDGRWCTWRNMEHAIQLWHDW